MRLDGPGTYRASSPSPESPPSRPKNARNGKNPANGKGYRLSDEALKKIGVADAEYTARTIDNTDDVIDSGHHEENGMKVKDIITAGIEPTANQYKVVEWIQANADGKMLGEPVLKRMKAATGIESLRIRRQYGMCHLEFGDYDCVKDTGMPGVSLLLAHSETSVYLDAAKIVEKNPAYFDAALSRNAARAKTLADEPAMTELEQTIAAYRLAKEKLKAAFAYGGKFQHDQYSIEKAFGLEEKR